MANISREERQRREAEAAKQAYDTQPAAPAPEATAETTPDPEVPEPVAETPEKPSLPERPTAPSVHDVNKLDLKHFQEHELAAEKAKSLAAIEQAVKDACTITEAGIRKDPVVVALAEDPGDVGKRMAFLRKFGPSNVIPPKPPETPYGIKDPALMEWMANYKPDEFIKTYGHSRSEVAQRLLRKIRAAA